MGLQILVAEDDRNMANIYKISLESKGHKTTLTYDGEECVARYRDAVNKLGGKTSKYEPFDVVVLDYRMPKMDGLAAAKEILKMNRDQRIVFASAYVKETLRDSVRELDRVVELIQKPFEPKVLVELIENTATIKELEEINKMVTKLDAAKSDDAQITELMEILKRVQKVGF
jgi:CheY-like chemotaxis protein